MRRTDKGMTPSSAADASTLATMMVLRMLWTRTMSLGCGLDDITRVSDQENHFFATNIPGNIAPRNHRMSVPPVNRLANAGPGQ